MQDHRTRRLAILFCAVFLVAFGALAACSTDNGTTPLPGANNGRDSGKRESGSSGDDDDDDDTTGDDDDDDDDDDTKPKDAGKDCEGMPTARSNPGVYCFKGEGTDDKGQCVDKVCCSSDTKFSDGGFGPSTCVDSYEEGACEFPEGISGRAWHCTEKGHCPNAGDSCCVIKGDGGTPSTQDDKDWPGCRSYFNSGNPFFVGGSRCKSDGCGTGELELCGSDEDCSDGKKCYFFKVANRFSGVCK